MVLYEHMWQDHHCLWINNCVGYANYKAFFILVFYATVASIYSTVRKSQFSISESSFFFW